LIPNNIAATMNNPKLLVDNAFDATSTAATADVDARANPLLRPTRRISIAAGTVVAATATTIIDIGRVAHAGSLVRVDPMIPPRVTKTIEPVADIS
jgi:hypothetical protein